MSAFSNQKAGQLHTAESTDSWGTNEIRIQYVSFLFHLNFASHELQSGKVSNGSSQLIYNVRCEGLKVLKDDIEMISLKCLEIKTRSKIFDYLLYWSTQMQ